MGKPQERPQAAMVESELKKTPGKDHVILTVRPISNGVQIHLEVEQGLVRLLGRLAVMGMEGKTRRARSAPSGWDTESTSVRCMRSGVQDPKVLYSFSAF